MDEMMEQEWSYFTDVSDLDTKKKTLNLDVPEECFDRLCHRLGLHSIEKIAAKVTLQRNEINRFIYIEGDIEAIVQQKCVVTTDPVNAHVRDHFDAWFAEPSQAVSFAKAKRERMKPIEREELPIMDETDDPEPVIDGKIDMGELVIQYVSLSLDIYPRADGVIFESDAHGVPDAPEDGVYDNPFAALKNWKSGELDKK